MGESVLTFSVLYLFFGMATWPYDDNVKATDLMCITYITGAVVSMNLSLLGMLFILGRFIANG